MNATAIEKQLLCTNNIRNIVVVAHVVDLRANNLDSPTIFYTQNILTQQQCVTPSVPPDPWHLDERQLPAAFSEPYKR
jgi:hypothetical protein